MLQKGDKINNYTLEKYLGKGSYGEVWLAKKSIELSDDGILVALKFLAYQPQKNRTEEDFSKQVKREVGTWIKASGHKNIVSVQDGFAFREDTFVIVSDFASGGSLADWLQNNGGKSPSLEKTVELMSEILDGLTHLHSQEPEKIIHRDLKPDNVLFKSGIPCITDFGVSRMSQTITQSRTQLAATSAGTPLYMSPESFNNQPASRSMDIWSAGVILYQMLSGTFPYYAENPISLALEVISGNPYKPLPTDVPNEFRDVVAKSLEKDVSGRFQTAEEMKAALKDALKTWENYQSQPVIAKPNSNVNDTIVDEDFDKTKILEVAPTEKAIEFEPKKEQISTIEVQNQQAELSQLRRDLDGKSQTKNNNLFSVFGIGVGLLGLIIVGIIILNSIIPKPQDSKKASNISTNQPSEKNLNKPENQNIKIETPLKSPVNTNGEQSTIKNSIGMEFVKIPSGTFMIGSPVSEKGRNTDETQHQVTISQSFYLGKYEVTQGQWKALMESNPSKFSGCGDNCPVEYVNWQEIEEFIKKLNAKGEGIYRLPTEAEWEYACRAGTIGEFSGSNLEEIAWYSENSSNRTHPVGQKKANPWGLYDMHGNVYERVQDWYGNYPNGSVVDPKGQNTGVNLVIRGGGWGSGAESLRSASRSSGSPTFRLSDSGFRLVVKVIF